MLDLTQQVAADSFGERLMLAIIGPLITVLLGTLIIGLFLGRLSERTAGRRADADRDAAERRADVEREAAAVRAREDRKRVELRSALDLKQRLVADAIRIAAGLYMATQQFYRSRRDLGESPELAVQRGELNKAYSTCRRDAVVLEAQLGAYFESDEVRETWHKIDDLLTIRYFQLIGGLTENLRRINAKGYEGKEHTGMSTAELARPDLVLQAHHQARAELIELIMKSPLREPVEATAEVCPLAGMASPDRE